MSNQGGLPTCARAFMTRYGHRKMANLGRYAIALEVSSSDGSAVCNRALFQSGLCRYGPWSVIQGAILLLLSMVLDLRGASDDDPPDVIALKQSMKDKRQIMQIDYPVRYPRQLRRAEIRRQSLPQSHAMVIGA